MSDIFLLLAGGMAIAIGLFAIQRWAVAGAPSLMLYAVGVLVWAVAQLLFRSEIPPDQAFWLGLTYLGATVTPAALFAIVLVYTQRGYWLTGRNVALLAIEPAITQILYWTASGHQLFFVGDRLEPSAALLSGGPWFWINGIYCIGLVMLALIWLMLALLRQPRRYRLLSGLMLTGVLLPAVVGIAGLAGFTPFHEWSLIPLTYGIAGLALAFGLLASRGRGLFSIAREVVVERMNDGWMVLDESNRIVDINPAAEALIGIPRDKVFGQPAEIILSNWPNVMRQDGSIKELNFKGSVRVKNEWRYLNIRASSLTDRRGERLGMVIVWQDITERRVADDARQQARDEMFLLLHAISGAASRALNLDDFLSETIYQIVYSFQSQSSLVFLLNEPNDELEERRLMLVAQHGISADGLEKMASIAETEALVESVIREREVVSITDITTDRRVPAAMQRAGHQSLLLVPMVMEEQVLGMIGLTRTDRPPYSVDEIARMSVVAEEVATFIHSERRRQLATVLAERRRLVRDLHDSVTQKLYGLVTLTEAAQAGLEAGSADMPVQTLARIGENARQALKEMRLFLFEMQPVDIEREGLVAVLHQRLGAVEGRADVKARLIADDFVSLPVPKEVALYFIAQEALNNVLRHAGAKAVSVCLKQKRENVILEVVDDGRGFDPKKDVKGGMGLQNMRDRVAQIGGKLKITSAPGKGTKIRVTVQREILSVKPEQEKS